MKRWILPALLTGLAAFLTVLPLNWAAKPFVPDGIENVAPDLEFRGTIWNGTISSLPIFGAANIKTNPLSRRALIETGQGLNYLSAEVQPNAAKTIDLRVNLADLPLTDGRLQGLKGDLAAEISEISFDGQRCVSAVGTLRTDVLQRNGGKIQWTGPELSGPIRCEDGDLIADVKGRDGQQVVEALIRLSPDGIYRADIKARTNRPEADAVLPLFGFTRSGKNFVLTEQGRWR